MERVERQNRVRIAVGTTTSVVLLIIVSVKIYLLYKYYRSMGGIIDYVGYDPGNVALIQIGLDSFAFLSLLLYFLFIAFKKRRALFIAFIMCYCYCIFELGLFVLVSSAGNSFWELNIKDVVGDVIKYLVEYKEEVMRLVISLVIYATALGLLAQGMLGLKKQIRA